MTQRVRVGAGSQISRRIKDVAIVVNERRASMFDIREALSMYTQLPPILYYGNLLLVSFGTSSGFKSSQ
jgi:hypothetical protein